MLAYSPWAHSVFTIASRRRPAALRLAEENRADMSTSKESKAGKASGNKRAKMRNVRRYLVLRAFEQLKPAHQSQPSSSDSITALVNEFRQPSSQHDPLPKLDPPLSDYESVVDPSMPAPSDKRMAMMFKVWDDLSDVYRDPKAMESIRRAKRDTLIADLKALGIRSKRSKKRSG
jgi:hypothetical protein